MFLCVCKYKDKSSRSIGNLVSKFKNAKLSIFSSRPTCSAVFDFVLNLKVMR